MFGTWPYSCRVTYWQLDGDAYPEAIVEAGLAGTNAYVILDQDAEGWWNVGSGLASLRGSAGFRVRNWPDERGPRSVIVEGAERWGTALYVQGITVFRLSNGRLARVLDSELKGYAMTFGHVEFPYRYTRSFVREETHRFSWRSARFSPSRGSKTDLRLLPSAARR